MKNYSSREGVDIVVAFATVAGPADGHRGNVDGSPSAERASDDQPEPIVVRGAPAVRLKSPQPVRRKSMARGFLKSTLRAPVKLVFRLVKPLIRPIAFRLRAYFLNGLRADIAETRQDMLRIHADAMGLRQHIRCEAAQMHREAQVERLKFAGDLAHQFHVSGNSLREDLIARLVLPVEVMQQAIHQLSLTIDALAKAAAQPIQSPQLDYVEQLAIEAEKARAETSSIYLLKFEHIEELAVEQAKAREDTMRAEFQKLDRIEQLALDEVRSRPLQLHKLDDIRELVLDEAKARAEEASLHLLRIERLQRLIYEEAKARVEALPSQSIKLDRIEKLVVEEARARAEASPAHLLKLDRIEKLVTEEAASRAEVFPSQSMKLDRIEKLVIEEASARAETLPSQLLKLDRIEKLVIEEARAIADALPPQLRKLDHLEKLVMEEAAIWSEVLPAQSRKLDRIEHLALEEVEVSNEKGAAQARKFDRIEQLLLSEAKERAETSPDHSQRLARIERLALEEAQASSEALASHAMKLEKIEQFVRGEAKARVEMEPVQSLKLDRIETYALAAARRFAVNCGGEHVMVRTEVGFLLCAGSDPALLSILIETGELEPGTRRVIQRILKPGDVFLDVGANVGLHTLAAARAMQGRGKIVAFEPFAETARLLEASVWLNGFSGITEIHQAAVSTSTGTQSLYLGATSGHHSLFPLTSGADKAPNSVEVALMKIDDVLRDEPFVTLIKIDVEGAELEVLETAAETIRKNPGIAIIAEFGTSHLQRTGHDSSDWISAFTKLGLDYRAINEQTGALEMWSVDQLESVDSVNLLFARADAPVFLS